MTWPRIKLTSSRTISTLTLVSHVVTSIIKIVEQGLWDCGRAEKKKTKMGHLVEGLMEKRGGEEEEKNTTFGGLDFDVCNPNSCLGGDTLTVKMIIDKSKYSRRDSALI